MIRPRAVAYAILLALMASSPILVWTGTIFHFDAKDFQLRMGTLAIALALIADAAFSDRLAIPVLPAAIGIAYVGFACIAGALNPYPDWDVFDNLGTAILFFLCASPLTRSVSNARRLMAALVLGGLAVSAYYPIHLAGWDSLRWYNPGQNAFGSTFGNRNFMAYFLVCVFPFGIYLALDSSPRTRYGWLGASLAIATTLVICRSRSGVISMGIQSALALIYLFRDRLPGIGNRFGRHRGFTIATLVIPPVLAATGLAIAFFGRNGHAWLDTWTHGRLAIWSDTFKLISQRPWIGNGPGSFPRIFPAVQSSGFTREFGFYEPIFDSHSVYLQLLVDTGILGSCLFALLVASGMGAFSWRRNLPSKRAGLAFFSGLSLSGCALFSITGEISNLLSCTVFSWLSLAIFYNGVSGRFYPIRIAPVWRPAAHALLVLACVAAVPIGARFIGRVLASSEMKTAVDLIATEPNPALAERHLRKVLVSQPKYASAYYLLGYIAQWQGDLRRALMLYDSAGAIEPYIESIHFNRALAWHGLGEDDRAMENLAVASRLYPRFAPAESLRSEILRNQSKGHR